ncbi:hypothetical protein PHMEG_0003541 [Phytophthora megakarya]|uniref:Uncharacterized protein n=1 Tax=Phytophthora megakarya TaxID=4795 RepID=A0A225WXM2_9STRA|nr:hypothetical protein PHMEG_0003541 [Phytophthora megakarya]
MIERLKNTKRSRGMSAEVWGDLISGLYALSVFLAGIRNKEWRSALATTIVNSIPQAVAVLLYKNMHLPVQDDSEFRKELPSSTPNENAMMQKMLELMESNQVLQQQLLNLPRSHRRGTVAATLPAPSVDPNGLLYTSSLPTLPMAPTPRGVRQDRDMRSQEGRVICGCCYILGHSLELPVTLVNGKDISLLSVNYLDLNSCRITLSADRLGTTERVTYRSCRGQKVLSVRSSEKAQAGKLKSNIMTAGDRVTVDATVYGRTVRAPLLDSGADASSVSGGFIRELHTNGCFVSIISHSSPQEIDPFGPGMMKMSKQA